MNTQPPEPREDAAPQVQGIPRGLVSSLCGLALLLGVVGAVCVLCSVWGEMNEWVRLALLPVVPVLLVVMHIRSVRRSGEAALSAAFAALMVAHVVLLPAGVLLAVYVLPLLSLPFFAAYALALLWYGARYHNAMVISAAAALVFAMALSIPLYWHMGVLLSGVLFLLLGALVLSAAIVLHKRREQKLAMLRVALKRREYSETAPQEGAEALTPSSSSAETR